MPSDESRRRALVRLTAAVGGVATAGTAAPFIASLALTNLVIPSHYYASGSTLVVGEDSKGQSLVRRRFVQ